MSVTRRAGLSGKKCTECKVWKTLHEFPPDPRKGRHKGYRMNRCSECEQAVKVKGNFGGGK